MAAEKPQQQRQGATKAGHHGSAPGGARGVPVDALPQQALHVGQTGLERPVISPAISVA